MSAITEIDPNTAWSAFRPNKAHPWNVRRAAHLYRRAGFGANRAQLSAAVHAGPQETLNTLLSLNQESEEFLTEMEDLAYASLATGNVQRLSAWWTYRMLSTPAQLLEKMTLFWHGHFATSAEKVTEPDLMFTQNNLLRSHALGDFADLVLEISRDPAMLVYLDSATNRKSHPNENYAREIMELFCLGEGNYSETDIRELARCFTGWEIKRNRFRFNKYQHDTDTKSILGQTGQFGGEDGVRIVVSQDSAPRFIVRKLIQYFVMDEPQPSAALIDPLAKQLRESDMQIRPIVKRILGSNLMFSDLAIGRKVRSPVEFAVGFLRGLEGTTNSYLLADAMQNLGQGLLYPPSVKGWDGGRTWINSSTLLGRANLIRSLLDNESTRFAKLSLREYLAGQGATSAHGIVDWFEETLFAVEIPAAARDQVVQLINRGTDDRTLNEAIHALCTLPEFQLC